MIIKSGILGGFDLCVSLLYKYMSNSFPHYTRLADTHPHMIRHTFKQTLEHTHHACTHTDTHTHSSILLAVQTRFCHPGAEKLVNEASQSEGEQGSELAG